MTPKTPSPNTVGSRVCASVSGCKTLKTTQSDLFGEAASVKEEPFSPPTPPKKPSKRKLRNRFFNHIEMTLIRDSRPTKYATQIQSPEDLYDMIKYIGKKPQEHFIVLFLNGANEVIGTQVVTIGLLNSSQVHPREVFRAAVMLDCASVIFAHNHPSGSLNPSESDVQITNQLCEAGKMLGIQVLDHVIVNSETFSSMKENGYM